MFLRSYILDLQILLMDLDQLWHLVREEDGNAPNRRRPGRRLGGRAATQQRDSGSSLAAEQRRQWRIVQQWKRCSSNVATAGEMKSVRPSGPKPSDADADSSAGVECAFTHSSMSALLRSPSCGIIVAIIAMRGGIRMGR